VKIRVLVVEDDSDIALAISRMVAKHFACEEVDVAYDGEEAWSLIRQHRYDLIVSDWNMPRKAGDELLMDVRSLFKTRRTPFLMLTARADRDSVITAVQAGVTDYLVKPFDKASLLAKLQALLDAGRDDGGSAVPLAQAAWRRRFADGGIAFPPLQPTVQHACRLLDQERPSADLVAALERDPALSDALLAVANGEGALRDRRSLQEATARLGPRRTRNVVLMHALRGVCRDAVSGHALLTQRVWVHSLATALCARDLSRTLGIGDPEALFAMGLVHDAGKLLLLRRGSGGESAPAGDELQAWLQALHVEAGVGLLAAWQMPEPIVTAVARHHDAGFDGEGPASLRLLALANHYVRRTGHSLKASGGESDEQICRRFALSVAPDHFASARRAIEAGLDRLQAAMA
jgi:putative nucleotidyltransferase with HDIG domain